MNVPITSTSAPSRVERRTPRVTVEPLTSVYLEKNPTGKVVAGTSAITDKSGFLIADHLRPEGPGQGGGAG